MDLRSGILMKSTKILILMFFLLIASINKIYAAAYQQFTNLAYDNPATLNTTQQLSVMIGGTYLQGKLHFNGVNGFLSGTSTSDESTVLPYGRLAIRITPQIVLGVDVTTLQYTSIFYTPNSVISTLSTATLLKSFDISPRLSWQINEKLAVGIGLLIDRLYKSSLSFYIPPFQLINEGGDWALGGTIGLSYNLNKMTFVNLSYATPLQHKPEGPSKWGPLHSPNYTSNAPLPGIFTLNLVRVINPEWIVIGTARYVLWGISKTLYLKNTALGGFTIPQNDFNSWIAQIATHYQLSNVWGIAGTIIYESNAEPTAFRPVGLPTYSILSLGLGADYNINKFWNLKLLYGHAFSNPPINTVGPLGPVIGRININGNLVDLSLNYKA